MKLKKNKFEFYELDKKPNKNYLLKYYQDIYFQKNKAYYKKKYSKLEIDYINSKLKQKFYIITKILNKKTSCSLLDIGCGKGEFISYFKKKNWKVTGIEKTSISFNKNINNNIIAGDAIEILKQLAFEKNKYDLIVMHNVFEHLLEPERVLILIKKILKINGLLSINVPNDESLLQKYLFKKKIIKKKYWIAYPDHINYFNINTFTNFMKKFKFNVVDTLADFPIEHFLFNKKANYIKNKKFGTEAHSSRILFEDFLMKNYNLEEINNYYRSISKIGLGRNINYICKMI